MPEEYSKLFYEWEERGRGWALYDVPIDIEPPCEPFVIPSFQDTHIDDGRVPSLFTKVKQLFTNNKQTELSESEGNLYPYQAYLDSENSILKSVQISLPLNASLFLETSEQFLHILAATEYQIAYEIIATNESIMFQFTCRENDYAYLLGQLKIYFPEMAITEVASDNLPINTSNEIGIIDLGLEQEYFRPIKELQRIDPDPYLGIFGACEDLLPGESVLLQTLFKGSRNPWVFITVDAVSDGQGGSFFMDAPEAPTIARSKTARPIYSVVVRMVVQGVNNDRTREILEKVTGAFVIQTRSALNGFIPLSNEGYSYSDHVLNVFARKSNRLGMLLNSGELNTLVHIPSSSISSPKLKRQVLRTKSAPKELISGKYVLGINEHIGITLTTSVNDADRLRHTHVIGATGVGKSTFLAKLFLQDVTHGNGCAIIDPHGDTIDDIITRIPEHRLSDVILIDPSDTEFPVGFNLLQATTEVEKIVLSSDLLETFKARSTSWGDTMTSVLANAINAFLESEKGGTLIELRRFLIDEAFRSQFLISVSDPSIRYYWAHDFNQLKKGSIAPLLTRLDTFLRSRIIRNMMAQTGGVNFNDILGQKKIVLIKLAQGLIGEDNSYVLGSLFLAKLYQAAQARQALSKENRAPFYLYIDEFHHFITPTLSGILSGARKYGLGLTLAHQEMNQVMAIDSNVGNAVLSNPGIRVCFRLGDIDAKRLESGFQSFDYNDLQNLGVGEAIARVGRSDYDFNVRTYPLSSEVSLNNYQKIVTATRDQYGISKDVVEKAVERILGPSVPVYREEAKSIQNESPAQQKVLSTEEVLSAHASKDIAESAKEYVEKAKKSREQREHTYLQEYVKQMAEQRGFKVETEVGTLDGGRIDVVVINGELKIACEISVTNTVEYEIKNIQKCIDSGFNQVIMLSQNPEHLKLIQESASKRFSVDQLDHVRFLNTDQLISILDSITSGLTNRETRTRGYRVTTNYKSSEKAVDAASVIKTTLIKTMGKKRK